MKKQQVREILSSMQQHQIMAIGGGIVGGKDERKFADDDLKMYSDAVKWFDENVMKNKSIK